MRLPQLFAHFYEVRATEDATVVSAAQSVTDERAREMMMAYQGRMPMTGGAMVIPYEDYAAEPCLDAILRTASGKVIALHTMNPAYFDLRPDEAVKLDYLEMHEVPRELTLRAGVQLMPLEDKVAGYKVISANRI
jgi:hypothetical protein